MSDTPEELMQLISRQLQTIAPRINAAISDVATEPTDWFLIVYTNPRASYVGTEQGTKDAAQALQHLLDRWDGTIFPLLEEPTPRMQRFRSQLRHLANAVHTEIWRAANQESVPFSLIIYDLPNPPIYIASVHRDDVVKVLPNAIAMLKTGEHVPAHEVT